MSRNIWVDPWRKNTRVREFEQLIDTELQYKIDFDASATHRGTSVSSVSWESEGTQSLTTANESLASNVATADVSASGSGFGLLKCTATFADGNTEAAYARIRIKDPQTRW